MMRKSAWLLSAGLFAVPNAGVRAEQRHRHRQPTTAAQPTEARRPRPPRSDQARRQQPVDTGDIVITATRRRQVLQDVPMAVSRGQRARAAEYRRDRHPPAQPARARRCWSPRPRREAGAASPASAASARSATTPASKARSRCSSTASIARAPASASTSSARSTAIEVLRGPQGTLFGRNASAGLISIITAKPQLHAGSRRRRSTIGNYDLRRFEAASTGADQRHARGPARRRLGEARRLPQGRRSRDATSTTATAGCSAARCCSSRATSCRSG